MNFILAWLNRLLLRLCQRQKSATHISLNSREALDEQALQKEIKAKKWWQGALISGDSIPEIKDEYSNVEWWIIASQTCNLYSSDFKKIPVIEIIAAKNIAECDSSKTKGDNPRVLHVEAHSQQNVKINLEVDIHKRCWISRDLLAKIETPIYRLLDNTENANHNWHDVFIGWLARSYTRITLSDEFNDAIVKSKIEKVILGYLRKQKDDLYGIYFLIERDADESWDGMLGEMPPPYQLGVLLVTYKGVDPEPIKNTFVSKIFDDPVQDPEDSNKKIKRAELAKRYGIRIIKQDIDARSLDAITIDDLKTYVRFTFIDYLSDSSMAANDSQ